MSSTIKDIQLGADLVIKAIGEDVKGYLTRSENPANKDDREKATLALRKLSIWQMDNDVLQADANLRYSINEAKLNSLSDAKIQEGGAFYKDVVEAHLPLVTDMHLSGKADYVSYFSDVHRPVELDIEVPQTRITEESMDAIAKRSLAFVEAAWRTPSSVDQLEGIGMGDVEQLSEALKEAGYLMPGENPERKQSLAEQTGRGTSEQRTAIYNIANTIASNAQLPDTVSGLDAVVLTAKQLQNSVKAAEVEEVFGNGVNAKLDELTPVNSDLQREDIGAIYMTLLIGAMSVKQAQISMDADDHDPENPVVIVNGGFTVKNSDGTERQEKDVLEVLGAHVKYLEETGVVDVLEAAAKPRNKGAYAVPGLAPTDNQLPYVAESMLKFIKAAKSAASYVHDDDEKIDGDAGGRALGGPHAGFEDPEMEEAAVGASFDEELDLEDDTDTFTPTLDNSPLLDDGEPVSRKVPERFVDMMASKIDELDSLGVLRRMGEMIGRDKSHNDQEIFSEGRTTVFGSLEDFMQGDGAATADPADREYKTNTYGLSQITRMDPEKAAKISKQAVTILPGKGFLAKTTYRTGSASVAPRLVRDYVNNNLVDEEGQPNLKLRASLRRIAESDRPLIATTEEEAKAWRNIAQQFVERENDEHRLRLEAAERKAGLWTMEISKRDLARTLQVIDASGTEQPLRLQIGTKGGTLGNDDTPLIPLTNPKGKPEELDKVKEHRIPGSMISIDTLRGAKENMDKDETKAYIVITGERGKGLVSQFVHPDEMEKEVNKKPKGLEPHLPDML